MLKICVKMDACESLSELKEITLVKNYNLL